MGTEVAMKMVTKIGKAEPESELEQNPDPPTT